MTLLSAREVKLAERQQTRAEIQAALLDRCKDILVKHDAAAVRRILDIPFRGNRPVVRKEGITEVQPKLATIGLTKLNSGSYNLIFLRNTEPVGVPIFNREGSNPDLSPGADYSAFKIGLGSDYSGGIALFGLGATDWELIDLPDQPGLLENGNQPDEELFAEVCIYTLEGTTTEKADNAVLVPALGNAALRHLETSNAS